MDAHAHAIAARATPALEPLAAALRAAVEALGSGVLRDARAARDPAALAALRPALVRTVFHLAVVQLAEAHGVLLIPGDDHVAARGRYAAEGALGALRAPDVRLGTGLRERVRATLRGLYEGDAARAVPALTSLFVGAPCAWFARVACDDDDVAAALDALAAVDWRATSGGDLGRAYEALLEFHAEVAADGGRLALTRAAGHARKTSGSYYTPPALVACALAAALEPALDAAARAADPAAALLALTVCDPSCGSGNFLLAAALRVARRVAGVRAGSAEPTDALVHAALREVVARCIHGVDADPLAVELCRVTLWLAAAAPGRAIPALAANVRAGDALVGATPAALARGIPDAAFAKLAGDDVGAARALRRRNRAERAAAPPGGAAPGADPRLAADALCAAVVWPKTAADAPAALTHASYAALLRDPEAAPATTRERIDALAAEYSFFHWHLAFPRVLTPDITPEDDHPTGWTGGFDVVVGNPPWEKLKLVEREYFAARFPAIAGAPTASARRGAIGTLRGDDPDAAAALERARRRAAGVAALVRATRAFPLCSRGDLNAYALFAERTRQLLAPGGRAGIVVPTGIATDETTQGFFRAVVDAGELRSLWDFENRRTFAAVHASFKFCVLALERGGARAPARFAFFLRAPRELEDPARAFELRAADLAAINPNTRTCPVFRSRRDADLVRRIHARVPVLRPAHGAGPWGASFATQFHMSADSGRFRGRAELERAGCALDGNALAKPGARYVPLYEAKMVHHFDHRFGDYRDRAVPSANVRLGAVPEARSADRTYRVLPRYWVAAHDHAPRPLADAPWLLGFRDICRSTDERTLIAAVLPPAAVGNPLPLVATAPRPERVVLAAMLSSFALDFVARTKVGGTHLNFFVAAQLPVLPPEVLAAPCAWSPSQTVLAWLRERVVELTYTADDVRAFALECGYTGAPFGWDRERRFQLRAELDAAFFWLYGLTREEVAFVMETFPIVQSRDIARHGSYRTRDAILAVHARLGAPPACR